MLDGMNQLDCCFLHNLSNMILYAICMYVLHIILYATCIYMNSTQPTDIQTNTSASNWLKRRHSQHTARKIREQPKILRKIAPKVFARERNEQMTHVSEKLTYSTEIMFVIFSAVAIIDIFVSNKTGLIITHAFRAVALCIVAVIAAFLLYEGVGIPEVRIEFYIAEIAIITVVVIITLIIQSVSLHRNRKNTSYKIGFSDVIGILVPSCLTLFNFYVLGKELYRLILLGKNFTPVNTLFTIIVAVATAVMSIITIIQTATKK